jgi:hypothetical protein
LLLYLLEEVPDFGHQFDGYKVEMILASIHDALLELHPAA